MRALDALSSVDYLKFETLNLDVLLWRRQHRLFSNNFRPVYVERTKSLEKKKRKKQKKLTLNSYTEWRIALALVLNRSRLWHASLNTLCRTEISFDKNGKKRLLCCVKCCSIDAYEPEHTTNCIPTSTKPLTQCVLAANNVVWIFTRHTWLGHRITFPVANLKFLPRNAHEANNKEASHFTSLTLNSRFTFLFCFELFQRQNSFWPTFYGRCVCVVHSQLV